MAYTTANVKITCEVELKNDVTGNVSNFTRELNFYGLYTDTTRGYHIIKLPKIIIENSADEGFVVLEMD